jgi:sugar-specific transcriptional regulator TrmB
MDESLIRLFAETKLNDKQAQVYLALLQAGQANVSLVAKESGLKRSNTYVIISELENLGYVYQVFGTNKKIYAATDPNKILADIKVGIQDLEEMLPYLRAIQRKAGKPNIQYYEGVKGAQSAFGQIYRPKDAKYILSLDNVQTTLPLELKRWRKRYFSGKARSGGKHLIRKQSANKDYVLALRKNKQLIRYLPTDIEFNIDIALVDGSTYLTSLEDNVYVTVINSVSIYKGLSSLFEMVWKTSKED